MRKNNHGTMIAMNAGSWNMYPESEAKFNWADDVIAAASQDNDVLMSEDKIEALKLAVPPKFPARDLTEPIPIPIKQYPSKIGKLKFLSMGHEEVMDNDTQLEKSSTARTSDDLGANKTSSTLASQSTESFMDLCIDPQDFYDLEPDLDMDGFFGPCSISSTDTEETVNLEDFGSDDTYYSDGHSSVTGDEDDDQEEDGVGNSVGDLGEDEDITDIEDVAWSYSKEYEKGNENEKAVEEYGAENLDTFSQNTQTLDIIYEVLEDQESYEKLNREHIRKNQNEPHNHEEMYDESSEKENLYHQSISLSSTSTAQPQPMLPPSSILLTWIDIFYSQDEYASAYSQSWIRTWDIYKPTPLWRVATLADRGIKVTDFKPTSGEVAVLTDEKLLRWRCAPSALRHVWSYL
ncbi:hypothetical protein ACMFMF_002635 [Clarireedia jacksonii]